MVLHPLAEVRIRVHMTIVVGGGKFVVHILRNGKRCEAEEKTDDGPYHSGTQYGVHRLVLRHREVRAHSVYGDVSCGPRPAKGKLSEPFLSTALDFSRSIR